MAGTYLIEDNGTRTSFELHVRGDKFEPQMNIHTKERGEWDARVHSHGTVERVDFACLVLSRQADLYFDDAESILSLIVTLLDLEEKLTKALAVPQKYVDPAEAVIDAPDDDAGLHSV